MPAQTRPVQKQKKKQPADVGLDFNHAMIYTRDVAASMHFYSDLLGFKLIDWMEWEGRSVYARLRAPRGTATIALHLLERDKTLPEFGGIRLYFEIKSLEKFCKRLENAGITLTKQPKVMPWGWKHAYLDDPDGHEVSLYWAGAKRFQKGVRR
jgi:catechol 2,3-dioxygenase-like lactoylglutathione lyase family enzyme